MITDYSPIFGKPPKNTIVAFQGSVSIFHECGHCLEVPSAFEAKLQTREDFPRSDGCFKLLTVDVRTPVAQVERFLEPHFMPVLPPLAGRFLARQYGCGKEGLLEADTWRAFMFLVFNSTTTPVLFTKVLAEPGGKIRGNFSDGFVEVGTVILACLRGV